MNLHVYSATLNALGQAGQFEAAREVLADMVQVRGIRPNAMFAVSLLSVYEKRHEGDKALALFRYLDASQQAKEPAKQPQKPAAEGESEGKRGGGGDAKGRSWVNIFVYNVLLSALSKSEDVRQCRAVFEEVERRDGVDPDRVTYETLIQAYAHVGDFGQADAMFARMLRRGFAPTDYAFAARIKAYAKNNLWREAVAILREVEEAGAGAAASVHVYVQPTRQILNRHLSLSFTE